MKATLYVEGTNKGSDFLKEFHGQNVEIDSLYKNIEENSPPLANIKANNRVFSLQLVDVRFIEDFFFIKGFVMAQDTKYGGNIFLRLKPL